MMKIIEDYIKDNFEQIEIISAEYIREFIIRILFNDGSNKLINFKQFLENSIHPSIRKYLDENEFKDFKIIDGNLNWKDYDLIFPLEDLYKGKI